MSFFDIFQPLGSGCTNLINRVQCSLFNSQLLQPRFQYVAYHLGNPFAVPKVRRLSALHDTSQNPLSGSRQNQLIISTTHASESFSSLDFNSPTPSITRDMHSKPYIIEGNYVIPRAISHATPFRSA